jgi:hypothetical protein
MQNSVLFRRSVVLPLDENAEQSLRANDVNTATAVQHLRIIGDAFFESLWKTGIFQEINRRCGSLIDDYEEEFVELANIPRLAVAVEAVAQAISQPELKAFFGALRKLAIAALALKRPLRFVL